MNNRPIYMTAYRRNRFSLPVHYLLCKMLINGRVLDYGCGYGDDGWFLGQYGYDYYNYDPYFQPEKPTEKYDTILCTYVLEWLAIEEREALIADLHNYMHADSIAYLSVQRQPGLERELVRITEDGNFLHHVTLDLPIIYEDKKYCIYQLSNS